MTLAKEKDKEKAVLAEEQPDNQGEAKETAEKAEVVTLTAEEFEQVKAHIDSLSAERDEIKQLAQRVQADFDNFRKRNATIHADSRDEGARAVIKELLPVLDNFERALEKPDGVCEGWLSGIKLVQKQLLDSLTKLGLCEIPTDGKFDPEFHDAVMQGEAEGAESGDILEVFQKGYKVNDRIIRHSMVKVAK